MLDALNKIYIIWVSTRTAGSNDWGGRTEATDTEMNSMGIVSRERIYGVTWARDMMPQKCFRL